MPTRFPSAGLAHSAADHLPGPFSNVNFARDNAELRTAETGEPHDWEFRFSTGDFVVVKTRAA